MANSVEKKQSRYLTVNIRTNNGRWKFSKISCYHRWRDFGCILRKRKNTKNLERIEHQPTNIEIFSFIRSEINWRSDLFQKQDVRIWHWSIKISLYPKISRRPSCRAPRAKTKTYEILNRYYYWLGIIDDVKPFVKNCYGCRKSKTSRNKYRGVLKPLPVPDRRWDLPYLSLMTRAKTYGKWRKFRVLKYTGISFSFW